MHVSIYCILYQFFVIINNLFPAVKDRFLAEFKLLLTQNSENIKKNIDNVDRFIIRKYYYIITDSERKSI